MTSTVTLCLTDTINNCSPDTPAAQIPRFVLEQTATSRQDMHTDCIPRIDYEAAARKANLKLDIHDSVTPSFRDLSLLGHTDLKLQ